jgi:hypothetical protein
VNNGEGKSPTLQERLSIVRETQEDLKNGTGTKETITNFVDMIAEQTIEDDSDIVGDNIAAVTGAVRKSRRFDSKDAYHYFSTDKNLVKQIDCFRDSLLKDPRLKISKQESEEAPYSGFPSKIQRRMTKVPTGQGIDIRTANR